MAREKKAFVSGTREFNAVGPQLSDQPAS